MSLNTFITQIFVSFRFVAGELKDEAPEYMQEFISFLDTKSDQVNRVVLRIFSFFNPIFSFYYLYG